MIALPRSGRILLSAEPTDMRKGHNGLQGLIALLLEGIDASKARRSKRYRRPREHSHAEGACRGPPVC